MKPYFFPLLTFYVFNLLLHGASAVRVRDASLIIGDWEPVKDVKDSHIREIGQFAVSEHNKETNNKLQFGIVVSGKFQIVSGINYRLNISAIHLSEANMYEVEVFEQEWKKIMKLTSFKQI
ncbi:hypothetical protein HHK36_002208 [Tetracentron sinense]|uniref:Cystatin domain-containing protein n=1 Tax=Tetracentron sinense TaxID=13715 RepID=A0A835DRR8_TETSI|nr:hypothetical protein HHK36_002208 [Tetracentron sinense]